MVDFTKHAPTCLLILTVMCLSSVLSRGFDVRRHLGTKTRYAYRLAIPGAPSVYKLPDPDGYDPVHLYLVARHGTRWPTGDRMRQINELDALFKDARNTAAHPWLQNWTAPFSNVGLLGGELHPIGADELWGLAYRLRKRFPSLASQDYLPKRFPVVSTQVARTAASASAFTSGFFPDVGSENPADDSHNVNPAPPAGPAAGAWAAEAPADGELGRRTAGSGSLRGQGRGAGGERRLRNAGEAVMDQDAAGRPRSTAAAPQLLLDDLDESLRDPPGIRRPQAVAMSMAPKDADPLLRFFEVCPAYAQHDEFTEEWISSWMQGNWSRLAPALERRLQLSRPMGPCEVEALWQLCLMEAGLYGITDQACSLFEPEEAMMLEWIDDIHLLETQSYGAAINYEIAAPLLRDAVATLRAVAAAPAAGAGGGDGGAADAAPAARLLFAHCETLVPLASLLGLFRPQLPPPPDASAAQMDAAVSPAVAQRHLQQLDTLEDLHVMVDRLHRLNGHPDRDGSSAPGGPLGSEDSHACYKGRPVSPSQVPPPEGWYPMFPNDDARLFKGARIAPFGANLALVLYRRKKGDSAASGRPTHLVRLLYNEQVVPVPGCGGGGGRGDPAAWDCDLDRFLELVQDKADPNALDRLCGQAGRTVRGDGGAGRMFEVLPGRRAGGRTGAGSGSESLAAS